MALPLLAAVCLLPLLSHRSQSAVGRGFLPDTPTSGQDIRSTAPAVWSTWLFGDGSPVDLWDGIPAAVISSRRVTAALGRPQKFPRKVPRRADPRSPQMMGVAQRGRLQFLKMSFWRIIRLLMIFASIQKL